MEDLQDRLQKTFPEKALHVSWSVDLGEETVAIDIEMFFNAVTRIFENAFQFADPEGTLEVRAFAEGEEFVLEVRQTKSSVGSDPASWGEEPFVSTRRGGYGLGLFRARGFLAVLGGALHISHDSGSNLLLSRVTLPLAPPE
jgi:K+-sensing histidine kinase KdpD